jgi:hypothetical protein
MADLNAAIAVTFETKRIQSVRVNFGLSQLFEKLLRPRIRPTATAPEKVCEVSTDRPEVLKIDEPFEMGESSHPGLDGSEGSYYVVERIVKDRVFNGTRQYLVKWEGYPESENTWEPKANFQSSAELLAEYHAAKESKASKEKKTTAASRCSNAAKRGAAAQAPPAPYSCPPLPPPRAKNPKIEKITRVWCLEGEIMVAARLKGGKIKTFTLQEIMKLDPAVWLTFLEGSLRAQ